MSLHLHNIHNARTLYILDNRRDLIDLAIEYSMIRSTLQFNDMNKKQQDAVLWQMAKLAGH